MKNIVIVGAGFSGLSLAYYLNKNGFAVSVIDKNKVTGGMIQSLPGTHGTTETAANGFLNTALVETFLKEIGASYIPSSNASKKRFIFRDRLRRWPLNILESLQLFLKALQFLFKSKVEKLAQPKESVQEWSDRHFTRSMTDFLLAPALQGIYAGDIVDLSGSLVLNPILTRKKQKKLSHASLLSSKGGMGTIIKTLEKFLIRQGVQFVYGKSWTPEISADLLVIATPFAEAATILQKLDEPNARENAAVLLQMQDSPLISVTQFFAQPPRQGQGFGVLFPRKQNVRPLGVLWNKMIFDRAEEMHSETWILGGALDKEIMQLEDPEILRIIHDTREKVFADQQTPLESKITRWPKAIPHYTVEHEKKIQLLKPMTRVILHGNYLGVIGLSRILEKSKLLAESLAKGTA